MSLSPVDSDEVWKQHPICNGRYLVSNTGKVINFKSGKLIKLQTSKSVPYLHFATKQGGRSGKNVFIRVHRLVAECFLDNPDRKPLINHMDGNKTNNHVDNLEWCTSSENVKHAYDSGLIMIKRGCENKLSALSKEQIVYIKRKYKPFDKNFGLRPLGRLFGVSHSVINKIVQIEN